MGLTISLINLGINFNLINIEKFTFLSLGTKKTITDNSVNGNVNADIIVKNLIDSPQNISYSKTFRILGNNMQRIGLVNNGTKINFHNIIFHTNHGDFFVKDYLYNTKIWYGECTIDYTACFIYDSFKMENNKGYSHCLELQGKFVITGRSTGTVNFTKLKYFYENPSDCYDFKGITNI